MASQLPGLEAQPGSGSQAATTWWRNSQWWMGIASITFISVISIWLALHPHWVMHVGRWGYLGAFAISLIASASIILPIPGLAVVIAMSNALNPITLGIVAGIGSALGELTGFIAGRTGRVLIPPERQQLVERLHYWTEKYGGVLLVVLAAIPFPLFDFAGIVAGIVEMPVITFLISVAIGKSIKYIVLIYLGAESVHLLQRWFG